MPTIPSPSIRTIRRRQFGPHVIEAAHFIREAPIAPEGVVGFFEAVDRCWPALTFREFLARGGARAQGGGQRMKTAPRLIIEHVFAVRANAAGAALLRGKP
jgi:hypothetical protein